MRGRGVRYVVVVAGLLFVGALVALLASLFKGDVRPEDTILAAYRAGGEYGALEIAYPFDETLFPPEIVAPTFRWKDERAEADTWLVSIEFSDGKPPMNFLSDTTQWTPSREQWETIKARSLERDAKVSIVGVAQSAPERVLSAAVVTISTSRDEVGAPLFYREVNLPFIEAVRDPSKIRWRFGTVSSPQRPPIVLEGLPVCGNCHSFSGDGTVLGMDVDYANDKGSYVITPVAEEILLARSKIITWSQYKREDKEQTFGLLSQVSPNGKHVVSTVKDLSVFVPKRDFTFSQLFFPIKGILAVHNRETQTFRALPGADDKRFVQSNPTWSPDGETIIFARSKVHHLKTAGHRKSVLLTEEECYEFLKEGKIFRYDLYRIPFNGGNGGKAEPLEGASRNGMSNYFAKYSPDGKWIVFCKANSYMLLQPDSELYIMPAGGGKARRMRCNTGRMNSWHSWSPNGKWLVFSSKLNGPYTQLFLTHVDQQGRSTPPVLLSHLTAPDRAANIPEFVNAKPHAIQRIREQFLDDVSFRRAAREFVKAGDLDGAIRQCRRSLQLNPNDPKLHFGFALLLFKRGVLEEARVHFARALELDPENKNALRCLRAVLEEQQCRKALELNPRDPQAHYRLATFLTRIGEFKEAVAYFEEALRLKPDFLGAINSLAWQLATCPKDGVRNGARAVELAERACRATGYAMPTLMDTLAAAYAEAGRFPEAVAVATKATALAEPSQKPLAEKIRRRLELYKAGKPYRQQMQGGT